MTASGIFIHPSTWFVLGAMLLPLARKLCLHKALLITVPLIAFLLIQQLPERFGVVNYLGFEIIFGTVDRLTFVFLHVFTIMAIIGCIYSLHLDDMGQHMAALFYIAGSLGVTLAGDYLTIFIFWELMAFASTFLIWCRKGKRSREAGYRYLLVHVAGGLLLFAGIFLRYQATHDLHFTRIDLDNLSLAEYLVMAGFCLNAAVPPLHAWLADAYPEATVTGAVFMCAFTTKTAVYVLARAFPGSGVLMIAGAIMTLYGVGFATIENDSRRILSYHIISQVGYMVCGIGIGTPLAINGVCAHAYAHIIYKALLLMGAGSVLEMTGRSKLNELGGLYRHMPATMIFTVIGGISISGFPLTSGFVSKSMIIAAAGEHQQVIVMVMLLAAAVGTFLSVGIKLPYFIWYGGKESGFEAKDPPWNMQLAMAVAAFLCIFIGCYPDYLYRMLPYAAGYQPYSGYHLSETLQIFAFTGLGFYLLVEKLRPQPRINLDLDWLYRKGAAPLIWCVRYPLSAANETVSNLYKTVGLAFSVAAARGLSRFDRDGIDAVLDGSARGMLRMGDEVKLLVSGRLQQYIGGALLLLFIIVAIVLWFGGRLP
ncbi:MAG: Na(+)/H(+) antiporter subunit D [Desulfuromonadales bacterium]|nr:Na(+)/H(+) antiporter subunit D [Desulfuromonadales bacterium]